MNIALWVVQVLLAGAFGMAGLMKTTRPIAELAQSMVWPGDIPAALVRVIGTSELLGAMGGLAALVAWGRWQRAPITPRSTSAT